VHYYKKDIGQYYKKAGRLTMLQHGAYTMLMDSCYDREIFPTLEQAIDWCWASTDEEINAVKFVLSKFFTEENNVFTQTHIVEVLDKYHENAATNKAIALKREADKRTKREQSVNDSTTNEHLITNKELRTNNNKLKTKDQNTLPGKPDDAIIIIDYLNEKTNKSFKPVDANKNFIKARIKEGHSIDNIKAVIDMKCIEWLSDERNNKYLRPATLFNATKFNQYVGELGSASPMNIGDEYAHYRKIGHKLGINPTSTESDRDYITRVKEKTNNA